MCGKSNTGTKVQGKYGLRRNAEQGLVLMREEYARDPSPSHALKLGVGYLWTEQYQAAWEHFQHAMQGNPTTLDSFFGMAGVAKWCVDEPDAAIKSWKLGLEAHFVDAAGGVSSPLLLWITSVLRPNVFSRSEAVQILRMRIKEPYVRNWPGALAEYVLNLIDGRTLEERSTERISQEIPARRKWLIGFYKEALELERGGVDPEEFSGLMRKMVDTSTPEWSDEGAFLQLLRSEEFYIARHEASRK